MQLIYLAAGRGSRLPKKSRNSPKCLTKIKGISIFKRQFDFFKKFQNKIIITGYKSTSLKKLINERNFFEIKNRHFKNTNMVHSMFLANKYINRDVVVCYGDVLFKSKLLNLLKNKENIMPVYTKWLWLWKKRMNNRMIKLDAEELIIDKNILKSIGGKIKNKLPKYQYMGIFKLKLKTFRKMNFFYKKLKNKKIDMTSFIDLCIKEKILSIKVKKYSDFWFEIDTYKDIKVVTKII
jgi:choline kinase